MPDPAVDLYSWAQLVRSFPVQFRVFVRCLFFSESVCDPTAKLVPPPRALAVPTFPCEVCGNIVSTAKACLQHCRVKDKMRCYEAQFVDDSGRCPVCRTNLVTRLRVLRHLCDPRRNRKCRLALAEGRVEAQPLESLLAWEHADKVARQQAMREGRIHPQAVGTALRADGRKCGRPAVA